MKEREERRGMGWLPDYPDFRDFSVEHDEVPRGLKQLGQEDTVKTMLRKAGASAARRSSKKQSVDLREWCSPIENQRSLGSCTAHAAVGVVEYFERKAFGKHVDASRLFLYKVTRKISHWTGDTGAFLRTTMGAMILFGVPPEEYWPYEISDFEKEPPAFCYAFAQSYQAINYYRLDAPGTTGDVLLDRIKINLASGLPSMFGFTVYSSISQAENSGKIPYPAPGDRVSGGHAVVAVGYDDKMKIKNSGPGGFSTTGAVMIRNSWGTGWGDDGYGWLPYDYVLNGLAVDWWSLLKNEWIDTGAFKP